MDYLTRVMMMMTMTMMILLPWSFYSYCFLFCPVELVELLGGNNVCGDWISPRSNRNMEITKATKSNMRSIIIKMLETVKSYLPSSLMSISILFYYLSSRCEGLANEVL